VGGAQSQQHGRGSLPQDRGLSRTFLTNFGAGVVAPYNLTTFELGAPIPVGKSAWGIAATAEGDIAVIASFFENKISIRSNVTLGTRPTGSPAAR
jgi:hypothetical protein